MRDSVIYNFLPSKSRIQLTAIGIFFPLFLIVVTDLFALPLCKNNPVSSWSLWLSWNNESFWQGFYCDVAFWKWNEKKVTLSSGMSDIISMSKKEDEVRLWIGGGGISEDEAPKSYGLSASRGYVQKTSLFSYGGLGFSFLNFSEGKSLKWVVKPKSSPWFRTEQYLQLLGVGIKFCLWAYESRNFTVETCTVPSYGISNYRYLDTQSNESEDLRSGPYSKSVVALSFRIPFTRAKLGMGVENYYLESIFPDDCGSVECFDGVTISQFYYTLSYRFGGSASGGAPGGWKARNRGR